MSLPREPANISDLERDAERYRQLVRMLQAARSQLGKIEVANPDIDQILERLLPDLTEALGAEQSFAAILRQVTNGDRHFELTHAYPSPGLRGALIPWNAWMEDLIRTGRAFSRVPLEPGSQDLVSGLELFGARSALVVRMEGMRDTRIVGICNEQDVMAGPFLASDCRVLDIIIQLVAVGLRVGERRSLELEGIQETAAAVSAELQLDRLLNLIAESAARVFRAPATSLMLWDGTDSLVIRAAHNLSDQYRREVKIPRSKVERRRKMDGTYAAEVIDLSREPLANPELIAAEGLHQVLSAPLSFSGELIGALNIYSKLASQRSPRAFDHHDIELAQIFAGQAAIAVHNANLYRASQQQTLHWKALHEASKAIVEGFATSRQELLDRIIEQAIQCIGVDGPKARLAFLQIYDPKRNSLSFECIYPPTVRANLTAQLGQERLLGRVQASGGRIGISGRAAQTGRSYLVADVRLDPDYLEVDPTTRAELDVPLMDRGTAIGVLSIESDQLNAFDENDRATLEGLAAMAVIAIRNAEQYMALETARRELEAARERDMTDLAHTLFHRIRNAVGDIPYHLDTIRERVAAGSDIGEPIRHVNDRVRSLKALSEALRTLVDETGDFGEVVEVLEFLEETVRKTVEHRSVEWQINAPPEAVRLYGNRALLADAVQSLVENACEAMDWRGSLTLWLTRPEATRVELRISDTGPGIPFEIQDRIFELGYTTKDDPYREHGRGLFTCKIIVQKHRGAITFDSQPGQGTTFMITLPAPDDQSIAAEGRSDHGTAGRPASFE